jgi:hypothetical protein
MLIHLIAAARPNFMKIAPLYHALKQENWANPVIVHTGQHYDLYMKYENLLRAIETKLGSVVGVEGGIDALRKDLQAHEFRPAAGFCAASQGC